MKAPLNAKGMTLLEVLTALILFTFIALSLTRMTKTTLQYKKKVSKNITNIKLRRNVFQLIRKDIQNGFYTMDPNGVVYALYTSQRQKKPPDRKNSKNPQNNDLQNALQEFQYTEIKTYIPNRIPVTGGFTGTQDSFSIASFSHIRNRENDKTGDQNIVSYQLKPCKAKPGQKQTGQCLWRKFSPLINQDIKDLKDYNETLLLKNVKSLKIMYYDLFANEWLREWKTGPNDKNILPSGIHIKIEFQDHKNRLAQKELKIPIYHQFLLPIQSGS